MDQASYFFRVKGDAALPLIYGQPKTLQSALMLGLPHCCLHPASTTHRHCQRKLEECGVGEDLFVFRLV
jgi:hypothetical protein